MLPARLSAAFDIPIQGQDAKPTASVPAPAQAEPARSSLPTLPVTGPGSMWLPPMIGSEAMHPPMMQSQHGAMPWPAPFAYPTPYAPSDSAAVPSRLLPAELAAQARQRTAPAMHVGSAAGMAAPSPTAPTAAASAPGFIRQPLQSIASGCQSKLVCCTAICSILHVSEQNAACPNGACMPEQSICIAGTEHTHCRT